MFSKNMGVILRLSYGYLMVILWWKFGLCPPLGALGFRVRTHRGKRADTLRPYMAATVMEKATRMGFGDNKQRRRLDKYLHEKFANVRYFFLSRCARTIIFVNYLHNSKNFRNFAGRFAKTTSN